jgi:hypothetical protein
VNSSMQASHCLVAQVMPLSPPTDLASVQTVAKRGASRQADLWMHAINREHTEVAARQQSQSRRLPLRQDTMQPGSKTLPEQCPTASACHRSNRCTASENYRKRLITKQSTRSSRLRSCCKAKTAPRHCCMLCRMRAAPSSS